jgi:hypothetical protein
VQRPVSTACAIHIRSTPSMQRSYPSVDTGSAQSMYVPAGIALENLCELAGIGIVALTGEFDSNCSTRLFHTKRIHWLGNVDQLKA